jgi:hypothetical protein
MPVIPLIWETDIEGLYFEIHPDKKLARPISKNKLGMVAHICNSSYAGDVGRRIVIGG